MMNAVGSHPERFGFGVQRMLALIFCALAFLGVALTSQPLILLAIAIVPLVVTMALASLARPFELCLLFVIFSFFRIHEAFPILMPFRIPSLLAIGTFAALGWNMFLKRSIKPVWSPPLLVFGVFFLHTTIGLIFAGDRPAAISFWQSTYVKIAVMVFAIAWLTKTEKDFRKLTLSVVFAGIAVACVALYNRAAGIGLVEGTRVTIGRSFQSVLGDPNDLSLVLLFPMAFATALAVTKGLPKTQRVLGGVAIAILVSAVLATQSRGGLLGCVAVWGVVANSFIKNKMIVVGGGGLGLIVLKLAAGIADRQSGGAEEGAIDESAMGRLHAWQAAWRMALEHPFVGVGLNNFLQNYFFYSDFWDGVPHAVHSTWFVVIAQAGFVGIAIFLTMLTLMVRAALRALKTLSEQNAPASARAVSMALVAGLAGFCVSGTFLTQGFTWPIYIQLALVTAVDRYARELAARNQAQ